MLGCHQGGDQAARVADLEALVKKQRTALKLLQRKKLELEAKLQAANDPAAGLLLDAGQLEQQLAAERANSAARAREVEDANAKLAAAKNQEEELAKKLKQLAKAYRTLQTKSDEGGKEKSAQLQACVAEQAAELETSKRSSAKAQAEVPADTVGARGRVSASSRWLGSHAASHHKRRTVQSVDHSTGGKTSVFVGCVT